MSPKDMPQAFDFATSGGDHTANRQLLEIQP